MALVPRREMGAKVMDKCLEIPAGTSGDMFLRECLDNGMVMGEQLTRLVDEVPGKVTALLSQGSKPAAGVELTSETSLRDGTVGGRANDSLACLAKKVQRFLARPDHVLIIEDALFRRQAPFLSSTDLPRLYVGDNVYWFVSNDLPGEPDEVRKTIHGLRFWGAVGIMTTWLLESPAVDRQDIALTTLNDLVAGVQRIVVSAYDGEGFLIWYRGGWEGQ